MVLEDVVSVPSSATAYDHDDVSVDHTTGGVVLLAANTNRKSAMIVNTGSHPMRVTTDGTDPTATRGKLILAGGILSLSSPNCPTAVIKGFCSDGSTTTANPSQVC